MVITRSQSSQNRQVETEYMDRSSDNESEASFPELLSRDQMVDLDSDDVLTRRQNSNSYSIDQRFNEINRQIGDLTNIVLTLTNQFASVNGEGNRLNPATTSTDGRSDMVTGVSNPRPSGSRTTPPNGTPRSDESIPQIADVMTEIHHLRSTMGETLTHPKILQTQVPLFKGNRDKYNEFEHLLLNHLRPHAHKLTEEQKLNYFQSLLRDDAIEFWQTLTITTETTLRDILTPSKKNTQRKNSQKSRSSNSTSYDTIRPLSHSVPSSPITKRLPNKPTAKRHRKLSRPSYLPNYRSSSKTNWQLQENTTPALKTSKHSSREDVNMPSYYQTNNSSNRSTKLSRHKKSQTSQLFRRGTKTNDQQSKRNSMATADTAQFTDTNGLSAEKDCVTKQRATTTHNLRKSLNSKITTQKHNQNTMPNWSAKFADIQVTPQKTAVTEYRKPPPTEACHTIGKPQMKTGTSDATSEEHTTTLTQRMK